MDKEHPLHHQPYERQACIWLILPVAGRIHGFHLTERALTGRTSYKILYFGFKLIHKLSYVLSAKISLLSM